MTLIEFIEHLKHSSLKIIILGYLVDKIIYRGTVGMYKHWIHKSKWDNIPIVKVTFYEGDMYINLLYRGGKND